MSLLARRFALKSKPLVRHASTTHTTTSLHGKVVPKKKPSRIAIYLFGPALLGFGFVMGRLNMPYAEAAHHLKADNPFWEARNSLANYYRNRGDGHH